VIAASLAGICAGFFAIHAAAVGSLNRRLTASRGRANALYVLCYYLGGAAGITAGGYAYTRSGWGGRHGAWRHRAPAALGHRARGDEAGPQVVALSFARSPVPSIRASGQARPRRRPFTVVLPAHPQRAPGGGAQGEPAVGRTPARMGEAIRRQRGEMGVW
jgi:MFS family permease